MIGLNGNLAAHKYVIDRSGNQRCIQIQIRDGVQRAFVDGMVLHELEVAHAPTALRFCKKTMDDSYPGGTWLDGDCPGQSPDGQSPC